MADAGPSSNRSYTTQNIHPPPVQGGGVTLSLRDFRALLGTDGIIRRDPPTSDTTTTPDASTSWRWASWMPRWMAAGYHDPHDAIAIYPKILREERSTLRQLCAYEVLVYTCLFIQLAVASTLVILSASSGDHHVVVAILGALTALITGVLSLVKGQGQPMRLLNYADNLRKVRDDIEFCERRLELNDTSVTYNQVLDLWNGYTSARDSYMRNRPDVWALQERHTATT